MDRKDEFHERLARTAAAAKVIGEKLTCRCSAPNKPTECLRGCEYLCVRIKQ